jgi:LPXTG-motif cell wall-anchored protein
MLTRKPLIRTAAAAVATVFITTGSMAPVHGGETHGSADRPAHAEARHTEAHAKADQAREGKRDRSESRPADQGSDNGLGDERGNGHTPVTVCHLLGDGSYNLLTFDENALTAHKNHGDLYPVPEAGCPDAEDAAVGNPAGAEPDQGALGHTPVTVCHVLGDGSYNLLTFDDSALDAHVGHGDLYPVPVDGCPTGGTTTGSDDDDDVLTPGGSGEILGAGVLGVERLAGGVTSGDTTADAAMLGVEESAAAARVAAVLGPVAGILPQTGAAPIAFSLAAGLVLVGAGATVLARRRSQVG